MLNRTALLIMIACSIFCVHAHETYICAPQDLLTPKRFDVAAKYIYVQQKSLGVESSWATEIYREHLRVWNNFYEPYPGVNFPHFSCARSYNQKHGFQDYVSFFDDILCSIQKDGFDTNLSVIPVDQDGTVIDGAHRLTACLFYKVPVVCQLITSITGQGAPAEMFEQRGLGQKYLDAMALTYAKLSDKTFIVIVFPSARGFESEVNRILSKYSVVVYHKKLRLSALGPLNLTRILYEGEQWVGNYENNFIGAQYKAERCFPTNSGDNPARIFLVEANGVEVLRKAKDEIRALFGIGNDSVHINDTHEETIKISQALFIPQGPHFLNYAKPVRLERLNSYLASYKEWLTRNNFNSETFCITGGGVLAAYGIRDCGDLDFISHDDSVKEGPFYGIESDNEKILSYGMSIDDIIFNPSNHFYYQGLKFATPAVVHQMKLHRNAVGDQGDLGSLRKIIESQ